MSAIVKWAASLKQAFVSNFKKQKLLLFDFNIFSIFLYTESCVDCKLMEGVEIC